MTISPDQTHAGASIQSFGSTGSGEKVQAIRLRNGHGMEVTVLSYGGIIQSLYTPDRNGTLANVVLGFGSLEEYCHASSYFGAIIGRFANRIRGGVFDIDGQTYHVSMNDPFSSVHGGSIGFDRRIWSVEVPERNEAAVHLAYVSPDGEEGYPGELLVSVKYSLDSVTNALRIQYQATTSRSTIVNLTNHSYFNLAGEGTGSALGHEIQIHADHFLPVDASLLPTGEMALVESTPFDFRSTRTIGERIRVRDEQLRLGQGYDHNYSLSKKDPGGTLELAARVREPIKGRTLEVWTTEPAIDFYAANLLDGSLVGTSGNSYRQSDAFALEPEHFSDSPNNPQFPSTVLRVGEVYRSTTEYRFGVE